MGLSEPAWRGLSLELLRYFIAPRILKPAFWNLGKIKDRSILSGNRQRDSISRREEALKSHSHHKKCYQNSLYWILEFWNFVFAIFYGKMIFLAYKLYTV